MSLLYMGCIFPSSHRRSILNFYLNTLRAAPSQNRCGYVFLLSRPNRMEIGILYHKHPSHNEQAYRVRVDAIGVFIFSYQDR